MTKENKKEKQNVFKFAEKITLEELKRNWKNWKRAVIVFDNKSFDKDYSIDSRSYTVSSDAKFFDSSMGGYSLYGNSLDGTDIGVRLEHYMRNGWIVEHCYIVE